MRTNRVCEGSYENGEVVSLYKKYFQIFRTIHKIISILFSPYIIPSNSLRNLFIPTTVKGLDI